MISAQTTFVQLFLLSQGIKHILKRLQSPFLSNHLNNQTKRIAKTAATTQ
jgi:hypothetical protein